MANTLQLSLVISAIDQATAPVRRINQAISSMTAGPRALGAALGRLTGDVGLAAVATRSLVAGQALKSVVREAGALGLKLGALAGIGGGGLLGIVKHTAEVSESVALASERLGVSVAQFQRLSFAATQSGVSADQFAESMKFLAAKTVETATGSEEATQWFRAAGVAVKDASGKLKGTDQLFLELSEAFAKSDKSAEKVKVAMALMGESGARMVPMMNSGARAIRDLGDEAEKFGLVRSEAAIKAAQDFGDRLDKLGNVIGSVGLAIGDKLIPKLVPLVGALTGVIAANQALVATKVGEWATTFSDALPRIGTELTRITEIAGNVVGAVQWVGNTFGYAESAAVAAGLYLGGPLIGAIANAALVTTTLAGSIGTMVTKLTAMTVVPAAAAITNFVTALRAGSGVMAAFNLVMAANPIGVVITGIGALAGLAYVVYQNWEPISGFFKGLFNGIVSTVDGAIELVRGKWLAITEWIGRQIQALTDMLPDFVKRQLGFSVNVAAAGAATRLAPAIAGPQLGPPLSGSTAPGSGSSAGGRAQASEHELVIRFDGAPAGTRVERMRSGSQDFDMSVDLGTTMVAP